MGGRDISQSTAGRIAGERAGGEVATGASARPAGDAPKAVGVPAIAGEKRSRKLLPAEQEFLDAHGITIQEAIAKGSIRPVKEISRYGKERIVGYEPNAADSYRFTSANEAMKKQKELRAVAESKVAPDEKLRESVWADMTDLERRKVRQDPRIFDLPNGALDWEVLKPYAEKQGKSQPPPQIQGRGGEVKPQEHASHIRATEEGSLLDADGNTIKPGEQIKLGFAGGPADMPSPWTLVKAENYFSTVNYKLNPRITVRAANGVERTYNTANVYNPRKPSEAIRTEKPEVEAVQEAEKSQAESKLGEGVTPTPEIKGMGGAVPAEYKPNLQTATGIKNAAMEKELARLGMPGLLEAQRQSNQALWDRVMAKIDLDPAWQDVLIADLKKKTRQLTDEEVFALDHRLVDLKVEHAKATREAAQAYDDGRMDAVKEAGERAQHWSNQIKELSEITKLAGTEWGRAGQARQRLLNEDYSLAALEMQKREANDWRPITDAERVEIQKTHDAYQAKLKEFEAQLEQKGRELVDAEIARALAESKAAPQYSPKVLQYAEKFSLYMDELGSSALARIKARQAAAEKGIMGRGAGVDPVELIDLSIYGASKITRGLVDSVKWADAMVRDVGEWIKPHLDEIFKASNAMVDERLAGFVKTAPEAEAVKRVVKKRDAAEKIDLATSSIEAKVKKGELDAVASDVQKLVRAIVERDPKIDREALINEVQGILKAFIPEITRLEAMDAISTRGKYTLPSEDVISAKVADLKTQIRLMGHQMDVEARKPLPPTGLQRRPLSDAARREVQRLNELKRKFGVVVTDMAKHLASVLDSQKTYYRNRLADLRHEIKTREKIVKSKTPAPTDLELEALRQEYKQTKADRDSIFETPGLTDLQRVELAERSTTRQIAVLERQKETGEIFPKSKQPLKLTSAKLEANRQTIAALKAEREWARDALQPKPERDPAVTALKAKTAALSRELEYWSGKLARGDFRPRTRKPPLDISGDAKAMRLLGEVESIKHKWKHGLYLDNMAKRSRMQKVWHGIRQGKDAFVNLLSSFDLSAPRQAFLYLLANLSRAITNPSSAKRLMGDPFVKMYQAMKSESVANGIEQWRTNRPNAKSGADKQMGIQYTELKTTDFTKWEDRAHSILDEWAEVPMRTGSAIKTGVTAIPKAGAKGVRMSNRAFITFLNSARANLADYLLEVNFKDRPPTAADLKVIGNLVNISTGRGNLNRGVAKVTGELLWSPSLLASRLQALSGQPLWGAAEWAGSGRARKIAAKEYVRWILSIVALYSVSRLFSDKRESDSTSSDFGKVVRGDTRIDPWAGFQQPIVSSSRIAKGITTGISGKERDISDFGTGEVIWNFFKNKARPDVAAIVKTAIAAIDSGKPASKVRVTVGDAAAAWVPVPLSVQEIIAVMRDRGMTEGAIIQVLATFGAGVSTYEEREKQR